jgi:hypothetical protein
MSSTLSRGRRLRIVVLGYIVRGPLGGLAWHHLQYVMGLARLGHDVHFLEDSGDSPWCCYDPSRHVTDSDPTYGLDFARRAFQMGDVGERWAYFDVHCNRWHGPAATHIIETCRTADLLVNLSGVNPIRPWIERISRRALIDTDPAFTQISHLTEPDARERAAWHNAFFSFGENLTSGTSTIPDDGFLWQATRQPIVLDAWPLTAGPSGGKFTTVMQWDSYPARVYGGRRFGVKSESFMPLIDLPDKIEGVLELAVGGRAVAEKLAPHGWAIRNPLASVADPEDFRRYIRESKAEFSVAKAGYVTTNSGWFSERSAAYLASGRPVVTEDTGFSRWLQSGGVLRFRNLEEAIDAIGRVNADYEAQCRAARESAATYFDSSLVLGSLVERAMSPPDAVAHP